MIIFETSVTNYIERGYHKMKRVDVRSRYERSVILLYPNICNKFTSVLKYVTTTKWIIDEFAAFHESRFFFRRVTLIKLSFLY